MLLTSGQPGQAQIHHLPEMSVAERARRHGTISCEAPSRVVAGTHATLRFVYEAGAMGMSGDGRLRIAWRWPFDWHELQTGDPTAAGYMVARIVTATDGSERPAAIAREQAWSFNPWNHHIELAADGDGLAAGDRFELVCGDRSGGGPGWRAPTFGCKTARFLAAVSADGQRDWYQLNELPAIAVEPGEPVALEVIAPSTGAAGASFELLVKGVDAWGNPAPLSDIPELSLVPKASWSPRSNGAGEDPPVHRHRARIDEEGVYRIEAQVAGARGEQLRATGNPTRVTPAAARRWRLLWGDIHSGQTEIGCGAGTLADHYRYARDAGGLQFATQQSNDHYVTTADWEQIHRDTQEAHEDGVFVAFVGCEWSPLTPEGGDRNVVYRDAEARLHRSGRFYTEREPDSTPDLPNAPAFFAVMRDRPVLINMHVGGRPANLDFHEPRIEPLVEIHSTHGTCEWFVAEALRRGYVVGITAGTDGVMGRPGADGPGWRQCRNLHSGLTALYAEDLTRESLWEAMMARRCYGTTGARIGLWLDVDGHAMGEAYETVAPPALKVVVEGTAAVERVDILRGTDVVFSQPVAAPGDLDRIRILWRGTEGLGTAGQQTVRWDGRLEVSGGSITGICPVGDRSPDDEYDLEDAHAASWRTATAGNRAGLVLRVEGDDAAEFRFASAQCDLSFTLAQARAGITEHVGDYDKRVEVSTAPREDGYLHAEVAWQEGEALPGTHPYWVRVIQVDQHVAWSSPVYVTTHRSA